MSEQSIPQKNTSKDFKQEAFERRERIAELVNQIGIRNAIKQVKTLAKHFQVSERSIYKDFDWIKGHWKPDDLRTIKIQLDIARNKAIDDTLQMISTETDHEIKAKLIQTLIQATKMYREELEAWGEKTKVAGPEYEIKIIYPNDKDNRVETKSPTG